MPLACIYVYGAKVQIPNCDSKRDAKGQFAEMCPNVPSNEASLRIKAKTAKNPEKATQRYNGWGPGTGR
jgi:hypothetical protein